MITNQYYDIQNITEILNDIGVLFQTDLTLIYSPPSAYPNALVYLHVSNVSGSTQTFDLFICPLNDVNSLDSKRLTNTVQLLAGKKRVIEGIYVPYGYGIYGKASSNDVVAGIPTVKESN